MSATAVDVVIAGKKTSVETGLFINGQFVKAKSGKTVSVPAWQALRPGPAVDRARSLHCVETCLSMFS